jgi:HEAT repeat protein
MRPKAPPGDIPMKTNLRDLLNAVYSGKKVEESTRRLLPFGREAVDAILDLGKSRMKLRPLPKGRDPRDANLDLQDALYHLFGKNKKYYLYLLQSSVEHGLPALFTLTWIAGSLGYEESIPWLIRGLKNRDMYIRWSCCESLIKFQSEEAVLPLIAALRDRGSLVKSTALDGIMKYNDPRALPNLTRLLADKSPGIRENAKKAIAAIEREYPGDVPIHSPGTV